MIVSNRWLRTFLRLPDDSTQVTKALTELGLEVASVTHMKVPDGVYVARIESLRPHPDADTLSVCTVNDGKTTYEVVCGAPNVRIGMHTALALPGTTLGEGMTVKKARIRGVDSAGMLCSEKELGISQDHSGIIELGEDVRCPAPLCEYIEEDDLIEIELTPDRGDCLSMRGVARDLAAYFDIPIHDNVRRPGESADEETAQRVRLHIDEPDRCPRYAGRLVRDVHIGPSPQWVRTRLISAGVRPINNVVDITNYVMLQMGHPMHAFDFSLIGSGHIRVRCAEAGERFTTLDEQTHALGDEDLLICDDTTPVALAGIMGGVSSGITGRTKDVFLECASFEPVGIRRSAKRLGIATESSHRFERGVDPGTGLIDALDTAAAMLQEYARGRVCRGRIDAFPGRQPPRTISVRPARVSTLLGVRLSRETIVSLLQRLQFTVTEANDGSLECSVPTYRFDCSVEVDLIEEVGRLYGYDRIASSDYATMPVTKVMLHTREIVTDTLRGVCAYAGLRELNTNSLTSARKNREITPGVAPVDLQNPLSPDMAQMRTSLLISLCDCIAYNMHRNNAHNRFFEIGRVFERADTETGVRERLMLAIALQGEWFESSWNTEPRAADIGLLKGVLERCLGEVCIGDLVFGPYTPARYGDAFTTQAGTIATNDARIQGSFGALQPRVCRLFDIKTDVYVAEVCIDVLCEKGFITPHYTPVSRYPALKRSFCFVMPRSLMAGEVRNALYEVSPLVADVQVFDVYEGEHVGDDMKSVAFAVTFRASDRTVQESEARDLQEKVITAMHERFGISLRHDRLDEEKVDSTGDKNV